jgi:hypothetical protein
MIAYLHIAIAPVAAFTIWTIAAAQGTAAVGDAISVFEKGLPAGWSVAERKANEYPWGHHFCDDYSGSKGTKVTVVGPKPVSVVWVSSTGESRQTPIAKESLEIWFMPPEYRDSWTAWLCFHRPIQPIEVLNNSRVRIYGRPSHRLNSEEEFRRQVLEQAQSVSWPGSPENDRSTLSWSTWTRDIEGTVRKSISK